MSDYTPTTEEIREYVETGGEPRPWVVLDEGEEAREKARGEAFDRWLAVHDAEVGERIAQSIRVLRSPNVIDMSSAGYNAGLESAALRAAGVGVVR